MSKHILFTNGILSARYDSEIHGENIPPEAVEASEELFFKTINEQDGIWSLVDGEVVKLPLPEPEPVIPPVVSMRQARLALLGAGLLTTVNDTLAAMHGVGGEAARIEWEYATEVRRNSQLVEGLSAAMNLDAVALDSLFTTAASL